MLRTQPIRSSRELPGIYISVMSRHTENDGKTPDSSIDLDNVLWLPELAPPGSLVGGWYKGRLGEHTAENFNNKFAPQYVEYIGNDDRWELVNRLANLALSRSVILMCTEPTPISEDDELLCHRRVLADTMKAINSDLDVSIL